MDWFMERAKSVYAQLLAKAESIEDENLRKITLELLKNPVITFVKVEPKITFFESPAAPRKHHAYPGGLLDHTLGVTLIAEKLVDVYGSVYGASIDRDVVIAAALLHDLFKYYQYELDPLTGGYRPRSDWYLGHDFAMVAELSTRGAPDKLIRAIAEAHGTVPFSMLESQIVHRADSTDSEMISQIQDIIWRVCLDIELEKPDAKAVKVFNEALRRRSIFDYAKIYYTGGRDALREYIKKTLGLD
ncbi:HD domain-containing protein [Hyperthermus butylicus]|uniref:HD superfamily metal-dependent phosphohydrolase n=1 Tax=Hyperthermus butylicus (strain DSM 5456 / JCM 9403 / PLM1-5) TaxID=415426 RepID=A2BIT7_HYPBU|nr:HD domain-containing protein [Hyperthermus butylicus]ABM79893.1 HD superfamily metal-dependent phosphohydrolase [Hyperthermus butylicus DSM 5456]